MRRYALFIDLTAAYDWCVRKWLFHTVFNRINPSDTPTMNCVLIIEELYKKTLSCMKNEDDFFETSSGVRQGGSESPCLFNLYLDYIMRLYEHEAKQNGLGVEFTFRIKDQARDKNEGSNYRGTGHYLWVGYADDLVITATSSAKLQISANILSNLLNRFGLVISISKTKTMILNYKGDDYPETILSIGNEKIDNVKEFVYLGSLVTFNEPGVADSEVNRRIGMALNKFSEIKKLLCNYRIHLKIRLRYYEVYIRSRLCYACGTWTLTKKQYERFESVHIGFLRRMIRDGMSRKSTKKEILNARNKAEHGENEDLERVNWEWKYSNNKILTITKAKSLKSFIDNQNLKWVSHVIRGSNETLTKQLMFPDERFKKRGRHHETVLEKVVKLQNIEQGKSAETFLRECLNRHF